MTKECDRIHPVVEKLDRLNAIQERIATAVEKEPGRADKALSTALKIVGIGGVVGIIKQIVELIWSR